MAERKPFLLRIDPALWAELEAWAQGELRSVNGQIEYILKQAVAKRRGSEPARRGAPSRKPRTGQACRKNTLPAAALVV